MDHAVLVVWIERPLWAINVLSREDRMSCRAQHRSRVLADANVVVPCM